jgi:hypothetical protein
MFIFIKNSDIIIAVPVDIDLCLYGLFELILVLKKPYITTVMRGF